MGQHVDEAGAAASAGGSDRQGPSANAARTADGACPHREQLQAEHDADEREFDKLLGLDSGHAHAQVSIDVMYRPSHKGLSMCMTGPHMTLVKQLQRMHAHKLLVVLNHLLSQRWVTKSR